MAAGSHALFAKTVLKICKKQVQIQPFVAKSHSKSLFSIKFCGRSQFTAGFPTITSYTILFVYTWAVNQHVCNL